MELILGILKVVIGVGGLILPLWRMIKKSMDKSHKIVIPTEEEKQKYGFKH